MPTVAVVQARVREAKRRFSRLFMGGGDSWTVCHGFAEAVQAVTERPDTASAKPWHTDE
jgi:hypothetical protein